MWDLVTDEDFASLMLVFELVVVQERGVVLLLEHLFDFVHFQVARQTVVEIADPEDRVVIFDRLGGEHGRKHQPVVDVHVVLIASLHLLHVRCQMRIDETQRRVVQFKTNGYSSLQFKLQLVKKKIKKKKKKIKKKKKKKKYFIAHFAHETGSHRLGGDTADVGEMFLLNENDHHHADQSHQFDFAVLGPRMQSSDNGTQPFVLPATTNQLKEE